MKRYILFLSALAAIACSHETEIEMPRQAAQAGDPVRLVHFQAAQTDTRARFGDLEDGAYPTLWTSNDTEVKLSLNFGTVQAAGVVKSDDSRTASFSAEMDFSGLDAPFTFYSVSPASAAEALSPSREAWKVRIPCEQTPPDGSADEAGIILAASSIPLLEAPSGTDVVDLHFDHLTAYGRLSFSNLALDGATVEAVELTATTPFVGDWYWECGDGHAMTDCGASSTLTLRTRRTSDIWFACAPVDMSGEVMTVSVITNLGVYEKMVQFPENRRFEAGRSAVFTVDMATADFTPGGSADGSFLLVTDASALAAGDEVLIVYSAGSKALGGTHSSGNYREPVDVSIDNGTIATAGGATVLTLETGTASGTWAFRDGSNYLTSPSSGTNNYLLNSGSVTDNSSWSVTIGGNGLATIVAQAGTRTYLQYNSSSPRFSCYASATQQKPSIYRRVASSGVAASDPMLARSEYGSYLGGGHDWTWAPGTDQVTRGYDAAGVLTYTLIDPADVEELEITGYKKAFVKGDTVPVTVRWHKGFATVLNTSYTMTLVKEEGPKVWLSDGHGRGFIIKK